MSLRIRFHAPKSLFAKGASGVQFAWKLRVFPGEAVFTFDRLELGPGLEAPHGGSRTFVLRFSAGGLEAL